MGSGSLQRGWPPAPSLWGTLWRRQRSLKAGLGVSAAAGKLQRQDARRCWRLAAPVRVLLKGRCCHSLLRRSPGRKTWRCSVAARPAARLVWWPTGTGATPLFPSDPGRGCRKKGRGPTLGSGVPRQAPWRLQGGGTSTAPSVLSLTAGRDYIADSGVGRECLPRGAPAELGLSFCTLRPRVGLGEASGVARGSTHPSFSAAPGFLAGHTLGDSC